MYLQHAFATMIHARSIGRSCSINQQVAIGLNGPDQCPTIGDDVSIRAGAKIIGAIPVGNNVVVGAGAVVTKMFRLIALSSESRHILLNGMESRATPR